ncbi:MAG: NADP-dependent isocitrate dehydrogenase, partial [Halobacteriaceae archaeon]
MAYDKVSVPENGRPIEVVDEAADELDVPDDPIIPIIYGDGTGMDVAP